MASMSGTKKRFERQVKLVRDLAAASREYLPMPPGPTPLAGPLEVVAKFAAAWESKDAAALGSLFAEDADYVNVVGLWWTSRHSIQRVFKRSFKDEFKTATFTFEKVSFRQVGSDAAVLHGRWQISGQVDPEDEVADVRRGMIMFVLEKVADASWLIVSAQATDIAIAADTLIARDGQLTATSYVPEVPNLPDPEPGSV